VANALSQLPVIIDTDITSFRTSANVLQGLRILKIILAVGPGGASSAGTVTITGSDGITIYPPLIVAAATAANTILYVDNPEYGVRMTWKDFAVTGVTATGTRLFIWFNV
jgi:hypothetical protein